MRRFYLGVVPLMIAGWLTAEAAQEIDLEQYILSRYNQGEKSITLPDGDVYFPKTVTLDRRVKNLTISGGNGTRLISKQLKPVFHLRGCSNLTLKNFAIDYEPLPFTQGTITRIDGSNVFFQLHDGYPLLTQTYQVTHPMFFDPTSRQMKWIAAYITALKIISDREGVYTLSQADPELQPGDYICLNYRPDCAIKIRDLSADITFENIIFNSAPGGGIISRRSDGAHIIRNCKMLRGPIPAGAKVPRLISTSADAFNYGTSRRGPIIENCEVEFIGDDSVNLHGALFPVVKKEAGSFLMVTGYKPTEIAGSIIKPGDAVRILKPDNFMVIRECKVKSITVANDIPGLNLAKIYPAASIPEYILFRVTLDNDLPEEGYYVDFPAINCPGFVIRNNYFHDHRARGLRIMASDGIIENNRFERLESSAIALGGEYAYWHEAGWTSNITIRNNTISEVLTGGLPCTRYGYALGAICSFVRNEPGNVSLYPGNRHLTIENNTISGSGLSGIYIAGATDVTIKANRISDVNRCRNAQPGKEFGINYDHQPIGMSTALQVKLIDNIIQK